MTYQLKLLNWSKALVIAPILATLFNNSIKFGEYPDCLKISQILLVPKSYSPSIPSHHRINFAYSIKKNCSRHTKQFS